MTALYIFLALGGTSAIIAISCCVASSRAAIAGARDMWSDIHSTPQLSHRPGKSGVTEEAGGQSNHSGSNYIQEQQHHG